MGPIIHDNRLSSVLTHEFYHPFSLLHVWCNLCSPQCVSVLEYTFVL